MLRRTAALTLTLAACLPDGWPPHDLPTPGSHDVACPGVPGVGADDPCCAVHQCLADAGPFACLEVDACGELGPDAVCGDQLCNGVECSSCSCELGLVCAEQFVDSFAGDECLALEYCAGEFPCLDAALEQTGCPQ